MDQFLGQEFQQTITAVTEAGALITGSPEVSQFIAILRTVAIIVTILLGAGIVALLIKMSIFSAKLQSARSFLLMSPGVEQDKISRQWAKIQDRIRRGSDAEIRLAVIEADQLLDSIFKKMNLPGTTMGERLQSLKPQQLANLPDLWIAHKMRNRLFHEPSSKISPSEAETVLQIYEKSLRGLGLLG